MVVESFDSEVPQDHRLTHDAGHAIRRVESVTYAAQLKQICPVSMLAFRARTTLYRATSSAYIFVRGIDLHLLLRCSGMAESQQYCDTEKLRGIVTEMLLRRHDYHAAEFG